MRPSKKIVAIVFATLTISTIVAGQSVNLTGIRKFTDDLNAYQPSQFPSQTQIDNVRVLLKLGRSVINSLASIVEFNERINRHDVQRIRKLVDISTIDVPDIRVNATLILSAVTENSTVCAVLDKLMESDLTENSRFNLLQVVKGVSNRLKNTEVKSWTKSMVEQNRVWVTNMEKPRGLLVDIDSTLNISRSLTRLRDDSPQSFEQCTQLKNFEKLNSPPSPPQ